ncbi:MAG: 2-C-methyl-D-erythritol 2,4-cyclodiphosphate synthase [Oscillospiraceae bacterium]|nr:2-C-methyl-D-erythritol 2,4-cyclodiphosphate synthase [Oscillospiraceae bacterium]
MLCGVKIPHDKGLLGHSDADVALHALMDALLGAAALGDIGAHFPDSDPAYKGISSLKLLRQTMKLLDKAGYKPSNIDITIIAEAPKLAPYITQMRSNTAKACEIPIEFVSVKATTEEGLNLSGKGIAANAVCMVKRQSSPNIHETFT